MRGNDNLSDSEKAYRVAKWLSAKKRETGLKEMPAGALQEFRAAFNTQGDWAASIWRDIAPV